MGISERIKTRRQELGLSVDEIADKLGIDRATYYRYESQEIKKFPLDCVLPLADILQLPPETLMGWDKRQTDPEPRPEPMIEIEQITKDFDARQLSRLLEYAKMLKSFKED